MFLNGDSMRFLDVFGEGWTDWIGDCINDVIGVAIIDGEAIGDWALILTLYVLEGEIPKLKLKKLSNEFFSFWKASGIKTSSGVYV
jgi:hypothetical protein